METYSISTLDIHCLVHWREITSCYWKKEKNMMNFLFNLVLVPLIIMSNTQCSIIETVTIWHISCLWIWNSFGLNESGLIVLKGHSLSWHCLETQSERRFFLKAGKLAFLGIDLIQLCTWCLNKGKFILSHIRGYYTMVYL